jgi:PTS system cellobiose-specific IIC component
MNKKECYLLERVIQFLERHLLPVVRIIAEQRHLQALRDGIVSTVPLLLIGSSFLICAFPPIPYLARLVDPYVSALLAAVNATFGIMGLVASFSIAYALAASYAIDALSSGLLSVSAFILASPFTKEGHIDSGLMGSKGLFVAMIIGLLVVEVQRFMIKKNIIIKMPEGVPLSVGRSFAVLLPGVVILVSIFIINVMLAKIGEGSIPEVINRVVTAPLLHLGGTLPAVLIAVFAIQLLWCFGIHGQALVGTGVMAPIWLAFTQQNAVAKMAGEAVPNIICQQFIDVFILIGGSGTTLALAVLLFTTVKSNQLKALGRTSLLPGIFNINEPIIFGMPIVMNPIMIIPFIVAPLLCIITTFLFMTSGFVDKPYALAPWTTPAFVSGFLVTGDWKGTALQVLNFIISGIIYYPFLKIWDENKVKEEQEQIRAEQMNTQLPQE